jgi:hypothetical protein
MVFPTIQQSNSRNNLYKTAILSFHKYVSLSKNPKASKKPIPRETPTWLQVATDSKGWWLAEQSGAWVLYLSQEKSFRLPTAGPGEGCDYQLSAHH